MDIFEQIFGNLAKSEPTAECPHCDHSITKSEVLAKSKNKAEMLKEQMNGGKHTSSGGGSGGHKAPHRTAPGVKARGDVEPSSYSAVKGEDASDEMDKALKKKYEKGNPSLSGGSEAGYEFNTTPTKKSDDSSEEKEMEKKYEKSFRILGGSSHCMWVDTGEDAYIAKSIENELLGSGAEAHSKPIDGGSSPVRNMVR